MVYLFIGQDSLSKDAQLRHLKDHFLSKSTEQFNLDILYGRGLALKDLQERILSLPVEGSKRIVIIKDARNLKEDIRNFLLDYAKKPAKHIILVLDLERLDKKDEFIAAISGRARTLRFKEDFEPNAFSLSRQINLRNAHSALRLLNQLLYQGEKPERILGGLRYAWERDIRSIQELKRRMRLLLNCDIDIKTGRLKPAFALEKLVISLCGPGKPFR